MVAAVAGPGSAGGLRIAAAVAAVFGLLTLLEGGSVLFGSEAARLAAGSYVPFVLWFNFLAGFVYVIAGAGLWLRRRWAVWLALSIAVGTAVVFAALGVHIILGGAFEARTVAAMTLRTVVWATICTYASRRIASPQAGAGGPWPAPKGAGRSTMVEHAWVREFAAGVTVCDTEGIITEMNDRSAQMFSKQGGRALLGSNVLECHPEPSRTKLAQLMEQRWASTYTTEKNGRRKLIHQAPWYRDGQYAGFVEIVLELPEAMPHFVRDKPA